MTKRELLLAICETPGWHPREDSSSIVRSLQELTTQGLVLPRLDGYEATAIALDAYPAFTAFPDIADPHSKRTLTAEPEPEPEPECVPLERVKALIIALLIDLPAVRVARMTTLRPENLPTIDESVRRFAEQLAREMSR